MPHYKGFGMINMQYEIRIWSKLLKNPKMTKTSQDNNFNYSHLFLSILMKITVTN